MTIVPPSLFPTTPNFTRALNTSTSAIISFANASSPRKLSLSIARLKTTARTFSPRLSLVPLTNAGLLSYTCPLVEGECCDSASRLPASGPRFGSGLDRPLSYLHHPRFFHSLIISYRTYSARMISHTYPPLIRSTFSMLSLSSSLPIYMYKYRVS